MSPIISEVFQLKQETLQKLTLLLLQSFITTQMVYS